MPHHESYRLPLLSHTRRSLLRTEQAVQVQHTPLTELSGEGRLLKRCLRGTFGAERLPRGGTPASCGAWRPSVPSAVCAVCVPREMALGSGGDAVRRLGPLMDSALMEDPEMAQVAE